VIAGNWSESARRSGARLACRPGRTRCCIKPFAITQLDAHRLREGLRVLATVEPDRPAAGAISTPRVRLHAARFGPITRIGDEAAIEHSTEPFGQLVVYYRANNRVPPESRR